MRMDFNVLEQRARELVESSRWREAMRIYLFMADGDSSLDAGYLGEKIAECYEALGDPYSARYWYGRANDLAQPWFGAGLHRLGPPKGAARHRG